jgi:hypothetical protein
MSLSYRGMHPWIMDGPQTKIISPALAAEWIGDCGASQKEEDAMDPGWRALIG